ncbi:MAG: amylo-alpha-1,6-glucosidase, partial [Nitrospiraceae bacterium]
PFVTAWMKTFGRSAAVRKQARGFLTGLETHLSEGCLGQVSEIFDADAPHQPRGCFAQAWSVAEPLRALIEALGVQADAGNVAVKRVVVRQRKEIAAPSPQQKKEESAQQGLGKDVLSNP